MLIIGLYAASKSKSTTQDYILASRNVGPLATALSAVSTCHSGFMFIGMIGFTYKFGVSASWMVFGWLIGDYIAWKWVYPKLRSETEKSNTLTLPEFIVRHLSPNRKQKPQWLIGGIIFIFVSLYAAAQLIAGSKALVIFLNTNQTIGILIGAGIVLIYSVSGGIRASIWTDVIQSIIMILAMLGLLIVALLKIGGPIELFIQLNNINPSLANPITNFNLMSILYILGWCAFGIGVIGQPHILTRPMAINSTTNMAKSRKIYLSWYTFFSSAAILIGLCTRVLLPELINNDPELGLPLLALQNLPEIFVGLILAGIFSACISTADSQILVCASTITQTFLPKKYQNILASRITTLITLTLIVFFSIFASKSVFFWVIFSWSILALIIAPLVFAQSYKIKLSPNTIFGSTIITIAFFYLWVFKLKLSSSINEVFPGFLIIGGFLFLVRKYNSYDQKY
ncbi:MAG: sodium/proline symporter [Candidatus Margulisiibacteriota bacterium]